MRPASSRLVKMSITLVCLVATSCTFSGLAAGQSAGKSKRKMLRQPGLSQAPQSGKSAAAKSGGVPPLTADSWTGTAGDDNWNTSTNWSAGVPSSSDAVTIGTTTATVNISSGAALAGSLTLSNSGDLLNVNNNTSLTLSGNITNNGQLDLNSSGNFTELILNGNVTLSGTGTVTLSNNIQNYIFGTTALNQLTNQETIQGAGQIGDGKMTLVNSGTINANQSAGLTIDANDGFTNTGTVEATGGNTLTLQSMGTINNAGGTISANASTVKVNSSTVQGGNATVTGAGTLQLNSSTMVGGTITNSSTGTIEIASGVNVLGGVINNSAGGVFKIDNNAFLDLDGGTYSQLGAVQLNSSGNFSELVLEGNVTLSGGSVTMSNNANNYIFGQAQNDTLTNQETIQGAGQIGDGRMTLVNSGTINANQSAGITIDANEGVTNTGTLEATSGATLTLSSTGTVNNAGGTISANNSILTVNSSVINGGNVTLTGSSTLNLNSSTIHGGTITNSSTGTIDVASGTVVLGGTINNSAGGTFEISNNAFLNLEGGNYAQLGAVQINSSGNFSELVLQGNVTLSGGSVTMSNNSNNYIFGQVATNTLTNNETISGAGQIGDGRMTLVNNGTINANQSAGITLNDNGGITNTGTLETTSGSTLILQSTAVNNAGGTITANTGTLQVNSSTINGGNVTLVGASSLQLNTGAIHGGTITNSSTGTIDIASGTDVLGGTINNSAGGLLEVSNNAFLQLEAGTYAQLGTVQLNSSGNFSELVLEGNVTLSGGTLTMSNNVNNFIFGAVGTDTLTNQETISGAGDIGNNTMTLVNSGTINANQSAGMTINANGGVTNTGTLEATSGSTLTLASTTINNAGGTISANTGNLKVNSATINGGTITLTGASLLQLNTGTVHGGTLTNSSTGTIEVATGANVLGGTINNSAGGLLKIDNNATLDLEGGTYAQLGAVQLNSTGNFSELVLEGNVTLSGGSVTMSNNVNNFIFGAAATDTLTNQETISGGGDIGNGTMTLVNSGTINADTSATLTVNPNLGVTNTGTMESTSGATLAFANTTVNNAGGTITANGGTLTMTSSVVNGGNITLTGASSLQLNSSTIHGGSTLTNSSSGTIEVVGGTAVLGGTINNSAGGLIEVANNTTLQLESGTYSQLGNVQLNSTGNFTELQIEGNVTLGGGTITMSANTNNFIFGVVGTDILTNQGTIQGAGNIGNGQMGLVNSGTILANASGNLVINVSGMNFNNTGTVEANGATLTIEGPSGSVNFLTNDNQSTGTLTGGTYVANGSNIEWNAGANNITTLAASVTEEGGGELFNTCTGTGCSSNMLAGLTSITSAGSLTIGGLAFTDAGSFSNAGSLTLLPGESFTIGSLAQISSGSLTAGTYVLDANLNLSGTAQTITTNAANLTLAGGTIENTSNSTNALAGLATNSGKLTIGGASNNVSTTAASFSNTGTLTINGGDSFTAAKLTQISGTTLSAGTYILGGNLDLTTSGISVKTNSANLTLQGGTINSNGVNALSALASNTKNLTIAGTANNVSTTAASFSNTGTLTINSGDSFTAPALTQISGSTLSGGTFVLAGNLDLTGSANVTTNSATLTLEGGTIQTGATNDLANLASNTSTLTITNNASVATAANFANTGTLDIASGSTFTVNGATNTYTQTAGKTTIDGTLSGIGGGASVTGGTIQGAGKVSGNLSVGTASVGTSTINVGDSGVAGLLAITGTYTQLATGTMTGTISGTALGTGFSQLQVTGAASLAGTINFTVATAFQSQLKVGETFTVLTASSVTGTFSNSTIAINSNFHFTVTYTSTSVVLTVASGPAGAASSADAALASATVASVKPPAARSGTAILAGTLRHAAGTSKLVKPVVIAGLAPIQRTPSGASARWEAVSAMPAYGLRSPVAAQNSRPAVAGFFSPDTGKSDLRTRAANHREIISPLAVRTGVLVNRRVPVKVQMPWLPRAR